MVETQCNLTIMCLFWTVLIVIIYLFCLWKCIHVAEDGICLNYCEHYGQIINTRWLTTDHTPIKSKHYIYFNLYTIVIPWKIQAQFFFKLQVKKVAQEEGSLLWINPSKILPCLLIDRTAASKWQLFLHLQNCKIKRYLMKTSTYEGKHMSRQRIIWDLVNKRA